MDWYFWKVCTDIIVKHKFIIGEDGVAMSSQRNRVTENWLPVKNITDGMIILNNNEKVSGVKIIPRNIFILSEEEQTMVISNLKQVYNQIDYEFWLVVADRPVDISVYMSRLQVMYNQTSSVAIRKLIMEDIQKANGFINNSVVDTEYYILFKEKNPENIQKKIRHLINSLSSCGLATTQVTNEDLRVVLDNFLNGGKTTEFRTVVSL
jgi:hypothetical protein